MGELAQRTQRRAATMNRIVEFLGGHIADVPAFHDLAMMAGMSRSHFSRTFHAVVGMSLRQYIVHQRVDRARQLLKQSTLSVTAIATECGFYDLPHLNKAFQRRFGVSPYRFRHGSPLHDGPGRDNVSHEIDEGAHPQP
jgi:AraC family transcriptional regulator